MTAAPYISYFGTTLGAGNTRYCHVGSGKTSAGATESQVQFNQRTAGTYSKLFCTVSANSASSTSTGTFRVSGADGNQALSIAASTTGLFQDTTHSDTVSSGANPVDIKFVIGTGTSITIDIVGGLFADSTSSNTTGRMMTTKTVTASSAGTYFMSPYGANGTISTSGENNAQNIIKTAATWKNGQITINTNGRSTSSTLINRINAANGSMSISIAASTTGLLEDTTNSDTLSSGDLINWQITLGSGSGTFQIGGVSGDLITTNNKSVYGVGGSASSQGVAASGTYPSALCQSISSTPTEAQAQTALYVSGTLSNLFLRVSANTVTATSTLKSRIGGSNGNQSISVGSSTTGNFEDASNTDSVTSSSLVNTLFTAGGSGTSATLRTLGMLLTVSADDATGTAAANDNDDIASASGLETLAGSTAATESGDTASSAGLAGIRGSSAITEGGDGAAASATEVATGSAAVTEGDDSASGTATETITATAAPTEGSDSASASGQAGIRGAADIIEDGDSATASGTETISGDASAIEDDDTAAAEATLEITGTAAASESDDSAAADGTTGIRGAATPTEQDDSASASGLCVIPATGTAEATEADDTASASGTETITGSGAATEGDDSAAASGLLVSTGSASATEADDSAASSGTQTITGIAGATESGDTASADGVLLIPGAASASEDGDTVDAIGTASVPTLGSAAVTEGDDSAAASGGELVPTGQYVYVVKAQIRRIVIANENRTYIVPNENRTYQAAA